MNVRTAIVAGSYLACNAIDVSAIVAIAQSTLQKSGTCTGKSSLERTGLFMGTTFSNLSIRRANAEKYYSQGVRPINPADFPKGLISYLGGEVCVALAIRGFNTTFSSGVSSGFDALIQGIYFAQRSRGNRSLIIELHETAVSPERVFSTGVSCFLVRILRLGERSRAELLGVESIFEKTGSSKGLQKVIAAVVEKYQFNGLSCAGVYSAVSRFSVSGRLLCKALAVFPILSKCVFPESSGASGLFALTSVLNQRVSLRKSQSSFVLLLSPGHNSNSSCMALRLHA